ncbi:ester cyclase [Rubrivirga marina]|uniref:ester cyclase n=1 Tax=Rubrivirga marina TaxID=1196024 RepID=UPI00117B13C4|nr:ester cyclase [Rubrivirga marina]
MFVETSNDIEFTDGRRFRMEEVTVQRCEDGKVVHERFYYTPPPGAPPAIGEE